MTTDQIDLTGPATGGATLVTFLLDRTGSMGKVRDITIGAFNEYLSGLKASPSGILFSLIQFDSLGIATTARNQPVETVQPLTHDTYQPRASTPLVDAAYKTILAVERLVASRDDKPKVVICIQTDGEENCSTEYTFAQLNLLIKKRTAEGWQFNFMGAGIDAYAQGGRMGIGMGQTVAYGNDRVSTQQAFYASAVNTAQFASGTRASTVYTAQQKAASGDKFDPAKGQAPDPKPDDAVVDEITLTLP